MIEWEEADLAYIMDYETEAWDHLLNLAWDHIFSYVGPRNTWHGTRFGQRDYRYFSDDDCDYTNSHFELGLAVNYAGINFESTTELLEWLNTGGSYAQYIDHHDEKPEHWDAEFCQAHKAMMQTVESEDPTAAWAAMSSLHKNLMICQPSS